MEEGRGGEGEEGLHLEQAGLDDALTREGPPHRAMHLSNARYQGCRQSSVARQKHHAEPLRFRIARQPHLAWSGEGQLRELSRQRTRHFAPLAATTTRLDADNLQPQAGF